MCAVSLDSFATELQPKLTELQCLGCAGAWGSLWEAEFSPGDLSLGLHNQPSSSQMPRCGHVSAGKRSSEKCISLTSFFLGRLGVALGYPNRIAVLLVHVLVTKFSELLSVSKAPFYSDSEKSSSSGFWFCGVFFNYYLKGIKIKLLNSEFLWINSDCPTLQHRAYSRTEMMAGHQATSKHICLCFTAASQSCLPSLLSLPRCNCTTPSALPCQ